MYDEDDRYDLEDRPLGKWIGLTIVVGVLCTIGFTMLRDQQSRSSRAEALAISTAATAPTTTALPFGPVAPSNPVTAPSTTAAPDETLDATSTTTAATTTAAPAPTPAPVVEQAPPTTAVAASTDVGYPAAADGSPLPVIVTYDTGTVTLTGAVPTEEARARLIGLAQANSQEPDVQVIDNLFVNPAVPASVGVRVIEMNSARFGEGEAQLLPEHTMQFDRVAAVLEALPHVTVLVIGHADQRGDDQRNRELSENRASTVVDYLAYRGINPTRLSMRGAGETDLMTLDDDASALALNRRTEFVFYGVLV